MELRRFLASPCASAAVKMASSVATAVRSRTVGWEEEVRRARDGMDKLLDERKVQEVIFEEEVREACEGADCLTELAMDLEISSVHNWGNAGPAFARCGVECPNLLKKLKSVSHFKIDTKRLLNADYEDDKGGPSPAYQRELNELLDGLSQLQRQTGGR
jgi:hypothetical protein